MNIAKYPSLFFILFFTCTNLKSQDYSSTFHTPMGNISIPEYFQMPMVYFHNSKNDLNTWDHYTIKLKNDSTLNVDAEIDMKDSIHALVIKQKRKIVRKIYPNETKYIVAHSQLNVKVAGIPNDSCWTFQQTNDSISLHSVIPINDPIYSLYFSKYGSKQLIPLNEVNLLELVGNDEKLIKIVKKDKNYVKAIQKYNNKLRGN